MSVPLAGIRAVELGLDEETVTSLLSDGVAVTDGVPPG